MQNLAKPAIAVALLAAIGIGCYTWGDHNKKEQVNVASPVSGAAMPPPPAQPFPLGAQPAANPAPQSLTPQMNAANPANSGKPAMPSPVSTSNGAVQQWDVVTPQPSTGTTLTRQTPMTDTTSRVTTTTVTPGSNSTVVEQKTATSSTEHKIYTQKVVHYKHHRTDKVHVARATKHGVTFALKLPGRLAL